MGGRERALHFKMAKLSKSICQIQDNYLQHMISQN